MRTIYDQTGSDDVGTNDWGVVLDNWVAEMNASGRYYHPKKKDHLQPLLTDSTIKSSKRDPGFDLLRWWSQAVRAYLPLGYEIYSGHEGGKVRISSRARVVYCPLYTGRCCVLGAVELPGNNGLAAGEEKKTGRARLHLYHPMEGLAGYTPGDGERELRRAVREIAARHPLFQQHGLRTERKVLYDNSFPCPNPSRNYRPDRKRVQNNRGRPEAASEWHVCRLLYSVVMGLTDKEENIVFQRTSWTQEVLGVAVQTREREEKKRGPLVAIDPDTTGFPAALRIVSALSGAVDVDTNHHHSTVRAEEELTRFIPKPTGVLPVRGWRDWLTDDHIHFWIEAALQEALRSPLYMGNRGEEDVPVSGVCWYVPVFSTTASDTVQRCFYVVERAPFPSADRTLVKYQQTEIPEDLARPDRIVFIRNLNESHWITYCYRASENTCTVYDSLSGVNPKTPSVPAWFTEFLRASRLSLQEEVKVRVDPNILQQNNSYDCGAYAAGHLVSLFLHGRAEEGGTEEVISERRIQMMAVSFLWANGGRLSTVPLRARTRNHNKVSSGRVVTTTDVHDLTGGE